jgi:hypothetical protein
MANSLRQTSLYEYFNRMPTFPLVWWCEHCFAVTIDYSWTPSGEFVHWFVCDACFEQRLEIAERLANYNRQRED